jgi:uncharacterized protein YjbI with pentapeptide repeats
MTRKETWKRIVDMGIVHGTMPLDEWNLGGVDLKGADLREADFDRSDLSKANLRGADLSGAYLAEVDLSGANLREANLCDADLSFANLNNADLRGCSLRNADTNGVSLHGSNLSGLDLRGGHLISLKTIIENANLSGVILSKENLSGSNLSNANFSGADLSGADLWDADFTSSNLSNVDLFNANLFKATLAKVTLTGSNLSGTDLTNADLSEAHLESVDLTLAKLAFCNLRGADLSRANLRGANLRGVNLIGANLSEANLSEVDLRNANLSNANLTNANLCGTNLFGATFLDAKIVNSNLKNSQIKNVNFNNADLSGSDITGAIIWGLSTTGWKIAGIKADFVYFTRNFDKKDRHKRSFKEGQFETLFKSLPTIELIFEGGLSLPEIWVLNAIIEDIKSQNPQFDLKLTKTSVDEFQTTVGIKTEKDEYLEKAASLILNKLLKDGSVKNLLPFFTKLLPLSEMDPTVLEPYANQPFTINQNITINLIKGDGSIIQSSPHAEIKCSNIINTYKDNRMEIESLFTELKYSLNELADSNKIAMHECVDRLIEVLSEGKNITHAQKIWDEIKEGVKTAGSAAGIISALSKLLGI